MVKVHNGWESKTINEVETLAAQRMSPGISTSHGRSLSDSPQTKTVGSSNRINRHVMFSPDVIPGGKRSPDSLTSSSEASEAGNWRYENSPRGSKKPSLAPPVDLGPRNPRRSNPPTFFPPSIDLRSGSNVSAISISSIPPRVNVTPPSTYRPIGISRLSQKPSSAMEQDAIETLLFMSSPGNTQYRSNHQPTPTSLYPGIIPSQPRKNNLSVPSVLTKVPNTDSIPVSPRKKMIPDGLDLGIDHNIDKMLDQMSSGSEGEVTSSEEDEN